MDRGKECHARRILVIDDNEAIHEDFRNILGPGLKSATALSAAEAALFGEASNTDSMSEIGAAPAFEIDFASQGQEGVELVRRAAAEGLPYAVAFVDSRMPPGWDGIETISRLWEVDAQVQVVMCTAYSDHSWAEIRGRLPYRDQLVILKKPFDNIEVQQLADALTEKWRLAGEDRRRLKVLEQRIVERHRDHQAGERIDARLGAGEDIESTAEIRQRRHAIEAALKETLKQGHEAREFTLHYQPIVDIASRRIDSLEALLRWRHPTLGAVSPAEFIPIAEETGLIVALGDFVLRAVCEQVGRWERDEVPLVRSQSTCLACSSSGCRCGSGCARF